MSCTGDDTTYFPLAHFPKSINRQRSLQKGKSSVPSATLCLHVGHLTRTLRLRVTRLIVVEQPVKHQQRAPS
jgi:hypothetical protein